MVFASKYHLYPQSFILTTQPPNSAQSSLFWKDERLFVCQAPAWSNAKGSTVKAVIKMPLTFQLFPYLLFRI